MGSGVVEKQNGLEDDLRTQLDVAGSLAEGRSNQRSGVRFEVVEGGVSSRNLCVDRRVGVVQRCIRCAIVSAVWQVEDVQTELAGEALVDSDRLEDAGIELIDGVSTEYVAAYTGVRSTARQGLILVVDQPMNGIRGDRCAGAKVEVTNSGTAVDADRTDGR